MNREEPPAWIQLLTVLAATATGIWGLWDSSHPPLVSPSPEDRHIRTGWLRGRDQALRDLDQHIESNEAVILGSGGAPAASSPPPVPGHRRRPHPLPRLRSSGRIRHLLQPHGMPPGRAGPLCVLQRRNRPLRPHRRRPLDDVIVGPQFSYRYSGSA